MTYSVGGFVGAAALVLGSTAIAFAGDNHAMSVGAYGSVNAQLEAMDDNRDAVVTRAEAKDFYDKLYRKLARTDGEAGMSVEDLVKGPQKLHADRVKDQARDHRKRMRDHFDDMDYNRDDMIDREEFLDGHHPRFDRNKDLSFDRRDSKLLSHFEDMDDNRDGYLSKDEFLSKHKKREASNSDDDHRYRKAKRALAKMDRNDDGSLSRLEFVNAQWDRFNRMDRDNNDELDRYEIRMSIRARGEMNANHYSHSHYNSDHDYGAPTDIRGHSDFETDLNEEISVWRNPDER